MANGCGNRGNNVAGINDGCSNNFLGHLSNHIGQTVTIFTTSGGQSGSGFTGVLAAVTPDFVRLITQIGPAPGCALGNCCDKRHDSCCHDHDHHDNLGGQGRASCDVDNLGSVVDIPCRAIASFVHNAVGAGGL